MVRDVEMGDTSDSAPPAVGRTIPAPPSWQPSRYGEGQKPNILAMAGSIAIVGGLLAALFTMNIVKAHIERSKLAVFEVLSPPEPPPPPAPPKPQPDPVMQAHTPSPVVAPAPLVQMPSPSPPIMTSPTPPPPEISIPGPPAPKPGPAPAIESAGDLSSKMISATPPRYPVESRRKREQGTVLLLVLLDANGSVANISISKSSGYDRLDQAALTAVRRWRWSPTIRGGNPVMVKGIIEIPFVLQDR